MSLSQSLALTSDIISNRKKDNFPQKFTKTKQKEFGSHEFGFFSAVAYARSLMLVLISMIVWHTSLHFSVSSFVLAYACAYVASETQASRAGLH